MNTTEEATTEEASEVRTTLDAILKDDPIRTLKPGELVEGSLLSRGTAAVYVDLGAQGTGIIFGREFFMASELLKQCDVGDTVSAKVVDPENEEGYVELSVSAAYQEIAWEKLNLVFQKKETVAVEIEAANRGGLMATLERVKAFLPVSQLSAEHYPRVEGGDKDKILEALKSYIGQKFDIKIINADQKQDKLILSEKAVEEEALREELRSFNIGDDVDGSITGVVDFGLFIKFGPEEKLEGLAHISELSWGPVEDINAEFKVGDKVKVQIVNIQGDKASLSLKALQPDPWKELDEKKFAIGAYVTGKPVRVTSFGAFVEVASGVQGIVRISEFSDETALREAFKGEDTQTFTIAAINREEHRMELKPGEHDIRPATGNEQPEAAKATPATDQVQTSKEDESEATAKAVEDGTDTEESTEAKKGEAAEPEITETQKDAPAKEPEAKSDSETKDAASTDKETS